MSQYAAELCTLLVEDNFGDLYGRVFSTLLRYDRLQLSKLQRYSRVPPKQLHPAVAAMIQMHLVYCFTSPEDGCTYYEANTSSAYYLIRAGKIVELIEDRLGAYAAKVMSTILYLGHARISHLETLPELQPERTGLPQSNGVNGTYPIDDLGQMDTEEHEDNNSSLPNGHHKSELHSTLRSLAAHGYIARVRDHQFQSPTDNLTDALRVVKATMSDTTSKGKKLEAEILEKAEKLVHERTDGDMSRGLVLHGIPRGVKRRHVNGVSNGSNKRPRLELPTYEEDEEEENFDDDEYDDPSDDDDYTSIKSDLVVRVDYEKLDVVFRHRRLVELAEQSSSTVTAQVYETLLRLIEYQTRRCRDTPEIPREGEESDQYSVAIPVQKLANEVDPHLDLPGSIGPVEPAQVSSRKGKRPLENGMNGGQHGDADGVSSGTNRVYDIDQHLTLLAQPPYNLALRRTRDALPTWMVEYRHLARHLRHLELERMVGVRFGTTALKLIRILLGKGKLDEKRLQEISLLSMKELRQTLPGMQAAGFVDLQEVPKDSQRLASRAVFLWFYDPDRVCRNVLQDTYKAMSRCLQRLRFERGRLRDFLDKTERTDVKGNEQKYLTETELKTLQQWRDKEALLLGEVSRLDDLVAVLRDY